MSDALAGRGRMQSMANSGRSVFLGGHVVQGLRQPVAGGQADKATWQRRPTRQDRGSFRVG